MPRVTVNKDLLAVTPLPTPTPAPTPERFVMMKRQSQDASMKIARPSSREEFCILLVKAPLISTGWVKNSSTGWWSWA